MWDGVGLGVGVERGEMSLQSIVMSAISKLTRDSVLRELRHASTPLHLAIPRVEFSSGLSGESRYFSRISATPAVRVL